MKGYIVIPKSMNCKPCKVCGTQPLVTVTEDGLYRIRCAESDEHYQTQSGLIDLEDWNRNNDTQEILPS